MKILSLFVVLTFSSIVSAQIRVENKIEFKPHYEVDTKKATPSVEFKVIVHNYTKEAIPNLDVSNRSLYLKFFINNEDNNPLSLYNGIESTFEDHLIQPGESDEYYLTWLLTEDSGLIEAYGEIISVYWTYKGLASKKIKLSLKDQKIL